MEALRIHVERIVRPIRAYGGRKNRMREELLAHLEQRSREAARNGEPGAEALNVAIAQLGDVDLLRQELQATVPRIERVAFACLPFAVLDTWFDKSDGESAAHYASERTAYTTLFMSLLIAFVYAVDIGPWWCNVVTGEESRRGAMSPGHGLFSLSLIASIAVSTFTAYFLADIFGVRRNLSNKISARVPIRAVSLIVFTAGYVALLATLSAAAEIALNPASARLMRDAVAAFDGKNAALAMIMFVALIHLVGMFFAAWATSKEHEQYLRWGRLKIDD